MARVAEVFRWSKKDIRCQFVDTRDFGSGSGMTQADIERKFLGACSKWAPHCGLTFSKSQDKPDILVKWAKLGRNPQGILKGGETMHASPVIITFSDDIDWTASIIDWNRHPADFFDVALHEIGHAIGMDHSSDTDAIMFPKLEAGLKLPILQDISYDDAVGARYLYQQPPLDPNPGWPAGNKVMLLVNETSDAVDYRIHTDTGISLVSGRIGPFEMTYWKENQAGFRRGYRVSATCKGASLRLDNVPAQEQVSVFKDLSGIPRMFVLPWGSKGADYIGKQGVSGD